MPPNRPETRPAAARRGLEYVLDPELLKVVWKKSLRSKSRSANIKQFQLAHDPLEDLAFNWDLSGVVKGIHRDVLEGRYRPEVAEIIRTGKRLGLTRPLAFLSPRDQLLYKTLVLSARHRLTDRTRPWTKSGGTDQPRDDDITSETSWFRAWLQRDKDLWRVVSENDWLIETDVSNFFASIPLEGLSAHLNMYSGLTEDSVRLLMQIIKLTAPTPGYREPIVGVPQDGFECSHLIAHSYLHPVDQGFAEEGGGGRYFRYVDDIVIGAATKRDAIHKIKKVQGLLEPLGLYANVSKTKVLPRSKLELEWFREENDYLGELDKAMRAGHAVDSAEFRARLVNFLGDDSARGRRNWERVVRRYFTASRKLRDTTLVASSLVLIEENPGLARAGFDYLSSFPLTIEAFRALQAFADDTWGLYGDLDLLLHECLCQRPNDDDSDLRSQIGEWALDIIGRCHKSDPRRASACCITLGKFGTDDQLAEASDQTDLWLSLDTVFRQQALILLLSAGHLSWDRLTVAVPDPGVESSRHLRYLRAIRDGQDAATRSAFAVVQPIEKTDPQRLLVRPRALFIGSLLRSNCGALFSGFIRSWKDKMQKEDSSCRDLAAERWLFGPSSQVQPTSGQEPSRAPPRARSILRQPDTVAPNDGWVTEVGRGCKRERMLELRQWMR